MNKVKLLLFLAKHRTKLRIAGIVLAVAAVALVARSQGWV